jgi:hypothetical protein
VKSSDLVRELERLQVVDAEIARLGGDRVRVFGLDLVRKSLGLANHFVACEGTLETCLSDIREHLAAQRLPRCVETGIMIGRLE